ncbi:hypothetical protein EJ05DRAFT_535381 [Pseudovirgaria hyperparasitica]|uniref:Uncharacterized protein n=1 Tax=Pseudovirgaria hyperparasitica TaxID=470096 RepID=A0A6A6WIW0_9PEZI|nr:uncharacterized protein EJ05DRAFT_535381 [Pseudovirgaria hyperparasitica]KAF2762104.1 hypothetical protein EJ05DRAFT_535381 [Pseudovirgaria hyperparasitica]
MPLNTTPHPLWTQPPSTINPSGPNTNRKYHACATLLNTPPGQSSKARSPLALKPRESHESLAKRVEAARILESNEMLIWYSVARDEVKHFTLSPKTFVARTTAAAAAIPRCKHADSVILHMKTVPQTRLHFQRIVSGMPAPPEPPSPTSTVSSLSNSPLRESPLRNNPSLTSPSTSSRKGKAPCSPRQNPRQNPTEPAVDNTDALMAAMLEAATSESLEMNPTQYATETAAGRARYPQANASNVAGPSTAADRLDLDADDIDDHLFDET